MVPEHEQAAAVTNLGCVPATADSTGGVPGTSLRNNEWVGSRFEVERATRIQTARFMLTNHGSSGTGFVAVLPMPKEGYDPTSAPDLSDSPELAHATFSLDSVGPLETLDVPLEADLTPGSYALLIGFGAFGTGLADPEDRVSVNSYRHRSPCPLSFFSGSAHTRWYPVGGHYRAQVFGAPVHMISLRGFAGNGTVTADDWDVDADVLAQIGTTGTPETFSLDVTQLAAQLAEAGATHLGVHFQALDDMPPARVENLQLRVVAPLIAAPPDATIDPEEPAPPRTAEGAAQITNLGTLGSLSHLTDILFGEPECPDDAPRYNRVRNECEPLCPDDAPQYNPDSGECEACLGGSYDPELGSCVGTCDAGGTLTGSGNNEPYTGAFHVGAGTGTLSLRYETYCYRPT